MTPMSIRESVWERESWLLFLEGGNEDLFKKVNENPAENSS